MSDQKKNKANGVEKHAHENNEQGQTQGRSVIETFQPNGSHTNVHPQYKGEADISKSLIIKGGSLFMLLDNLGDADITTNEAHGLYFHDCRFLNKLTLQLGQQILTPLLNSDAEDEIANFELVNSAAFLKEAPGVSPASPAIRPGQPGGEPTQQPEKIPAQSIGVTRSIQLGTNLVQTLKVTNFAMVQLHTDLKLCFDSDFLDIFTIRGTPSGKRGIFQPPQLENNNLIPAYQDVAKHLRRTSISFEPAPTKLEATKGEGVFQLKLDPHQVGQATVTISLEDQSLDGQAAQTVRRNSGPSAQAEKLENTPQPSVMSSREARHKNVQRGRKTMLPSDQQYPDPFC